MKLEVGDDFLQAYKVAIAETKGVEVASLTDKEVRGLLHSTVKRLLTRSLKSLQDSAIDKQVRAAISQASVEIEV
jgi:hypothetical protein